MINPDSLNIWFEDPLATYGEIKPVLLVFIDSVFIDSVFIKGL